ncbi:DUF6318 family protein [Aeromicrobium marinum]|uniref:DUF6318 family protein n=1 Tax=Aeromicrobium marinum TaxID=219314 RepID=UPI001B7F96C1|nr:DUF6318 family protein [Aeromicrobium marinum]
MISGLILIGGCGGDDPVPREPEPTPSSTATPPPMPDQARENTVEGAAAFVTYYVDVLNYAAVTGDVDELEELTDPSCEGCARYVELFRNTYADGGAISGGAWSLGTITIRDDGIETLASTDVQINEGQYTATSSSEPEATSRTSERLTFGAVLTDAGWSTTQLFLGDPK